MATQKITGIVYKGKVIQKVVRNSELLWELGNTASSYLLDLYPNASRAYSFRKLSSSYNGACCRIRRSSDNSEMDIPFAGDVIDTVALINFVGSGNGLIAVIYDQSGNTLSDWKPDGSNPLPTLVINGSVNLYNGFPAMNNIHPTTANLHNLLNLQSTSGFDFSVVQNTNSSACINYEGGASSSYYGIIRQGATSTLVDTGNVQYFVNSFQLTDVTRGSLYDALTGMSLLRCQNIDYSQISEINLNYTSSQGYSPVLNWMEKVIYETQNDVAGVEANIKSRYGL